MKTVCIILFIIPFLICCVTMQEEEPSHRPIPRNVKQKHRFTNEWQELAEDEAVPAGLHIRINLSTGKKEAKLLDKEESSGAETSLSVVEKQDGQAEEEHKILELERRLKHIPAEEWAPSLEELKNAKKKFRPYEELKKEFEDLKMAVKTDLEIMDALFASYQKVMEEQQQQGMEELGNLNILSPLEESHLNILTDLEYMVHQVDNAKEFVENEGLKLIVYPSLNSSSSVIRTEAARLLGSAVQNNAASQIKALESGAVGTLLRTLARDSAASVRSAALYALSCLVRRFPIAQRKFVDEGGLAVLASLFDGDSGEQLKLQVKTVTFIDDLLVERQDARLTHLEALSSNDTALEKEVARERLHQYKLIDLERTLQEQHWCHHLVKLFKRDLLSKRTTSGNLDLRENSVDLPDLDSVEKLTKAMISLAEPCKSEFLADAQVQKLILELIDWLKRLSLSEEEETDDYYTTLADQVKVLGSTLGIFHTSRELPNLLG